MYRFKNKAKVVDVSKKQACPVDTPIFSIIFNPNSLDNKGSCWILKDFYCSVTMLRELGLIMSAVAHYNNGTFNKSPVIDKQANDNAQTVTFICNTILPEWSNKMPIYKTIYSV